MSEVRTSGPLLFTAPNNPTRVGEIINTLNEIYDIPMPRLGMSVYVKDEGVNYTITKLEPKLIEGVLVPDAKVAECELQTGKSIAWNSSSNINDYVVAGVYNIAGTRWRNDGLPIDNMGENATIAAKLFVTVTPEGATTYRHSIGQTLILTNAKGKETKVYTRNGNRTSTDGGVSYTITWGDWSNLQTNINVNRVEDLDKLIDNGIYSGVWLRGTDAMTFVCVVINDYALSSSPRRVSQFIYGLNKVSGNVEYLTRIGEGDTNIVWGSLKIINEDKIAKMISDEIAKVVADAPETFDTLKEIAEWISSHGRDVADIYNAINTNANNFAEAKKDIDKIPSSVNGAYWKEWENTVDLKINKNNGTTASHSLPAATTEKAGIMTARDKRNLDASIYDAIIEPYEETVELTIENHQGDTKSIEIPSATIEYAGVMTARDKTKVNSGFVGTTTQSQSIELNSYTKEGVYNLLNATFTDGSPILNNGVVSGRLTVLVTQEEGNKVVTQVLNLNNHQGGEGNVYIRSQQNGTWKPWGKLQTNVEVGQITPDDMSNLIDNGIYSGVCVDGATVETFVLIVINNYLASSQAGTPRRISQLKYATDTLTGQCTVKKRVGTGDDSISWGDWEEIGGGSNEVDITDAVITYGLPTLISQGLAKEGVTYKVTIPSKGELPVFDQENEISTFISPKVNKGVSGPTVFKIKVLHEKMIEMDCYSNNSSNSEGVFYYKFYFYPLGGAVKVSADMTEL